MTRTWIIRPATVDDADTVIDFNRRLAQETEGLLLSESVLRPGVLRALRQPEIGPYYLAVDGAKIAGQCMVTFEWSDWRNGWLWWFQSVYVDSEFRGQGVFRALFDYVAKLARDDREAAGLRLYVEQNNHIAQQTYRALGMKPSGHLVYELDGFDGG